MKIFIEKIKMADTNEIYMLFMQPEEEKKTALGVFNFRSDDLLHDELKAHIEDALFIISHTIMDEFIASKKEKTYSSYARLKPGIGPGVPAPPEAQDEKIDEKVKGQIPLGVDGEKPKTNGRRTIEEQILDALEQYGAPLSPANLKSLLGHIKKASVSAALSRLNHSGAVERTERGYKFVARKTATSPDRAVAPETVARVRAAIDARNKKHPFRVQHLIEATGLSGTTVRLALKKLDGDGIKRFNKIYWRRT